MNTCIRCGDLFNPRWPKSKICKACSKQGTFRGIDAPGYKDGKYTYESIRREIKAERRYCSHCQKDLLNATHYFWVIHHKDHDHFNNASDNLELLCKRCHQIEHKCWRAFEGATTISKESTAK